jgi:polyphosphate kinase
MSPQNDLDLARPELYINRELSLLEFNRRVFEQALDERTPLLERLRFLTICSTNLDEFFEIRVSGLKQQLELGLALPGAADGIPPRELLSRVSEKAHQLVADQYAALNNVLLPALALQDIQIPMREQWNERQALWARRYFLREVAPVLTPVAIDPAHPFPRVLNKSLNFLVSLEGQDAFGRSAGVAVVNVPRSLPRLIPLSRQTGKRQWTYVLLSSIIHAHIGELFPGMSVLGCYQFRVTRNSDLWVEEEEVDNLLQALEGELPRRHFGSAVRLEVANTCPQEMADFLLAEFGLTSQDLYRVHGPVNLHRLESIYREIDRPDLKYPSFVPGNSKRVESGGDLFALLRKGDLLLHHPYQSFGTVIEFLRQAAKDPAVLAIKQTLYRTGKQSVLVDLLIEAARAGKDVTAVVELRARFDEAANIDLATRLQEAGVHVVYGIVGYKTHAKLLLVVRREGRRLKRYVHLSTGNYHPGTARAYTDLGLLTCDAEIGEDVHNLFSQLTGMGRVRRLSKLMQAPFTLQHTLVERIEAEASEARAGRPARIAAKMNSLTEPGIIQALYAASMAGVEIDLIVRGACCLRPGLPGISEHIRVRSVIGRFLEHHRVYYFHAAGEESVFASSADWMFRNFFRRVEACFPIEDKDLRRRVLTETIELALLDDAQSWAMQTDGSYRRVKAGEKPVSMQLELLEKLSERIDRPKERRPAGSAEIEPKADVVEQGGLVAEVGQGQRMGRKPAVGKPKPKLAARRAQDKRR